MATPSWHLNRRTFLRGLGATISLPYLECMGKSAKANPEIMKRACFVYTANGVSLPPSSEKSHQDWHWFPHETGRNYRFTKPLSALEPLRDKITILGGIDHPTGSAAHTCSDIWLTCGDLSGKDYQNSISIDQLIAREFRGKTRESNLSFSCDGGVGMISRIGTLSFDESGRPVPSENRPRLVFERLFSQVGGKKSERRKQLQNQGKMIDRILENSKSLNRRLGTNDQEKMDEFLTSISEIEDRVDRYQKWLDMPLPYVDPNKYTLDVDPQKAPQEYYRTMFDLFALAFETDLTRVGAFMMSREDGFGIADTFPTLLFKSLAHHALSHGVNKKNGGYENWSRYDQFIGNQFAYFLDKLNKIQDANGPALDNTVLLFGSGCSTTHNTSNLPLVLAGGKNFGLDHGRFLKFEKGKGHYSNLHLSILKALGIDQKSFADSSGPMKELFKAS